MFNSPTAPRHSSDAHRQGQIVQRKWLSENAMMVIEWSPDGRMRAGPAEGALGFA